MIVPPLFCTQHHILTRAMNTGSGTAWWRQVATPKSDTPGLRFQLHHSEPQEKVSHVPSSPGLTFLIHKVGLMAISKSENSSEDWMRKCMTQKDPHASLPDSRGDTQWAHRAAASTELLVCARPHTEHLICCSYSRNDDPHYSEQYTNCAC